MPRRPKHPMVELEFKLEKETSVELGALLKFATVCGSGGEAKHLVQSGAVKVNGQVELRRGRKLVAGDKVEARGKSILVSAGS